MLNRYLENQCFGLLFKRSKAVLLTGTIERGFVILPVPLPAGGIIVFNDTPLLILFGLHIAKINITFNDGFIG